MKKVCTIALLLTTLMQSNLFAQWTNLNAPQESYLWLTVSPNGKNIAAYSTGLDFTTFKFYFHYVTSHDYGASWQVYSVPDTAGKTTFQLQNSAPQDFFWDGDDLYVHDANPITSLKKSSNFGASFTVQNNNFNAAGKIIQSPNGNWYMQYQGYQYSSSDKGATWNKLGIGGSSGFMEYLVANNGNIVSTFSQGIAYSTDGGATWTNSTFSTNDTWTDSKNSISKSSDGTLICLGKTATRLYKSTNNGVSWQLATSTLPVNPIKLLWSGNEIVTLSTNGSTYKSTDGGSTFTQMTKINGILSNGAAMAASNSDIFIAGASGIYKYSGAVTDIENEVELAEVSLYPTPCQEILYINSKNSTISYSISNLAGQSVLSGVLHANQINLGGIESGIYLLTLVNGEGKKSTKKIIKQ